MSGSRTAQMSMTAARSASARTSANALEHGRGPVVGQRLVDGPQPATRVALASGREGRPHRGRVVGVVVEDGDAADLALELEPATDALEGGEAARGSSSASTPADQRAGRGHQPVDGHVPPDEPQADAVRRDGPAAQAADLAGPCRRRRRRSPMTGPARRSERRRRPPASPSLGSRTHDPPPGPAVQGGEDARGRPRSPTFATSVGGSPSVPRGRPAIQSANAATTLRLVREDVRVVPFRGDEDGDVRAIRVEVAGVLVRLDDEVRSAAEPGDAALRPGDRGRQDGARRSPDGSRPAPTSRCRSQPDVVDLPCVPVTPMSRRPPVAAASAMTCWTLSGSIPTRARGDELRVVGLDRRDRLGDRHAVDDGRAVGAADVRRVVAPGDRDAGRERPRRSRDPARRASHAVTTAPAACAWSAAPADGRATDADDVDARPGRDRSARSRGAARPRAMSSAVRVTGWRPRPVGASARSRSRSQRPRRRSRSMFAARSPVHWNRRTSDAGRVGRPPRRRARPASRPSRRPGPATPGRSRPPRSAPSAIAAPAAIASGDLGADGAMRREQRLRARRAGSRLTSFGVAHDAAEEVAGRARDAR